MESLKKFNPLEEQESRKEDAEKLKDYIKLIAEDLKSEGIPVTSECRIDPKEYRGIYNDKELEKDERMVKRLKEIYANEEGVSIKEWEEKKIMKDGEQLEMLKTAIFHKNLSHDFVVVRASEFDDIKRKIDNVIINKKTGSVICALDESSPRTGEKYNKKQEEILKLDKQGGVNLRYGLTFKDRYGKPILKTLKELPVFLLALHPSEIVKGIEKFNKDNEYEKKLFKFFITEIDIQIKKMEEGQFKIPLRLQTQWSDFRKFIKEKL